MKNVLLFCSTGAFAFVLTASLQSQTPPPPATKTPLEALQTIKAANDAQLQKQTEMLVKLEELQKHAQQIKFSPDAVST